MNVDFYHYNPKLDLDELAVQGTDRVLEELRLTRAGYEALQQIIEASLDGFFVTDGQANVICVNKSYEEMSGVQREEILGKNMRELEQWTISKSASLLVLQTGKSATIEQEYLRTGRHAYITSTPVFDDHGEIVMIISNNRDFAEIDRLKRQLEEAHELADRYEGKIRLITDYLISQNQLVARDERMYDVLYNAAKVAGTDTSVLVLGETGTGKEEIAKFIHQNSARADKSFIRINCGAISKELIESELFGYERGAFTGASTSGRVGYFEVADGGTLFLDEIGEMPLELQTKLLRVLQEGEFLRVGGSRPVSVNVRVIASTNRKLSEMVQNRQFREDLYYRLNVVRIEIPPLRERRRDIAALADFYLKKYNDKFQTQKALSPYAYRALEDYRWPGNVRELKNTIERMVIMSEGDDISAKDLLLINKPYLLNSGEQSNGIDLKSILEQTEYEYIKKYYTELGTLKLVAEKLNINLKTLSRRRAYLKQKYDGNS
ncbi:MAG: sigma-54 interaction domain-containing protein [Kiritimatiellales bacterium]